MKRAINVGGGYAGTTLARALDPVFDLVLIEAREAFVHNMAAIRALATPALLDQIILPYDRLLNRGKSVRGQVSDVSDQGVTLASGDRLSADLVVLATGRGTRLAKGCATWASGSGPARPHACT